MKPGSLEKTAGDQVVVPGLNVQWRLEAPDEAEERDCKFMSDAKYMNEEYYL